MIHDVGANYTQQSYSNSTSYTGNTLDVTVDAKIANGVLGQSEWLTQNFGTDYFRSMQKLVQATDLQK